MTSCVLPLSAQLSSAALREPHVKNTNARLRPSHSDQMLTHFTVLVSCVGKRQWMSTLAVTPRPSAVGTTAARARMCRRTASTPSIVQQETPALTPPPMTDYAVSSKVSAQTTRAQKGRSKTLMLELVPEPLATMAIVAGFLPSALVTVSVPLVR